MMNTKYTLQCLVFNKNYFPTRKKVKDWVLRKGYKLLNCSNPVKNWGNVWRVRQKNPSLFKSFKNNHKIRTFVKNKVKGIYGVLKDV